MTYDDMSLEQLVVRAASLRPDDLAVHGPDGAMTYAQLDARANQVARSLMMLGVRAGDRIAIWTDKSAACVAAMQGVLRVGAAYVPIDSQSPLPRTRSILENGDIRVVVTNTARAPALEPLGVSCLCVDGDAGAMGWSAICALDATAVTTPVRQPDDLAYILYTSGSTGTPKGVCISHRNALAFIAWSADVLDAHHGDRFSNHAPFFFDLSVLDLYVPFLVGGSVWLIPEQMAFVPAALVDFLIEHRITVWYSVPSALIMMMQKGGLLTRAAPELRVVIFAGEPFPPKPLATLRRHLAGVRLLNFYGPTETNVCTWYEVDQFGESDTEVPIGQAACGDTVWLEPVDGGAPDTGQLMVKGPTVMIGYWGKPPVGDAPYATGDLVRRRADGNLVYLGRQDNMLKVRGRRMEAGEIEAALVQHPAVSEAVVVAQGTGLEARLVAFLIAADPPPGLVELKRHCASVLPRYMIIDEARFVSGYPRTRNGKVDRNALRASLG